MTQHRRQFFKTTSGIGLSFLATSAYALPSTPSQTEGPFFPVHTPTDTDADLTKIQGRPGEALGEKIDLTVKILDSNENPVVGAEIDMWQACATGRYLHPGDPNTGVDLDPNFQYWTRLISGEDGTVRIKTIVPGSYPATSSWDRPPHLHFKIKIGAVDVLITQMYFAGESLNEIDSILQNTRATSGDESADSLIVEFSNSTAGELPQGEFTIKLGNTPSVL